MSNRNYDNSSITSLKGADRVRLRPSVIFGSDDIKGSQHTLFEILSNCVDEAKAGFGNEIRITKHCNKSWTLEDFGRGLPMDWNEKEQRYNWELCLCEMYAGGKYKVGKDSQYEDSLGLNGLGLCSTQYSSEFMRVTSVRDGYIYQMSFNKGEPIGQLSKDKNYINATNGTSITYIPDKEVFTDVDIPIEWVKQVCQEQSVVAKGVTFVIKDESTNEVYTYLYKNGIYDYIIELAQDKAISDFITVSGKGKGKDVEDRPEYDAKFEMVFCFNNEYPQQKYFHNSSNLEYGGSPQIAVRNGLSYVIDKYLKDNGKYNKNESKISNTDIEDSLLLICSSFSTSTSYENQTKKAITNKFIKDLITDCIKEQVWIYFIENPLMAEKICNQILVNKRSREKAERTRINSKKQLSGAIDITNRIKKFVDCRTKDKSKRELYIVEGDSALGSCKLGRNAEFQGVMPVRGKILNCLKADYDKIFKSDIIIDLIKILGCGIEVVSKHNKELHAFDLENLRWDKVIICTDADVDGYQIRTLILTMIYRLMPTLIKAGKVYIVESPLYEIQCGKDIIFAYSDKEKDDIVSKLGKCHIQRSKGLGENDPDMMWNTTMNPETRKLIQVTMEDIAGVNEEFELLLGDNLEGRKQCISNNFDKYLEVL